MRFKWEFELGKRPGTETRNQHPERVLSPLFERIRFFDPNDKLQVKCEMLRSHEVEAVPINRAAEVFGYTRQGFYQVQSITTSPGKSEDSEAMELHKKEEILCLELGKKDGLPFSNKANDSPRLGTVRRSHRALKKKKPFASSSVTTATSDSAIETGASSRKSWAITNRLARNLKRRSRSSESSKCRGKKTR